MNLHRATTAASILSLVLLTFGCKGQDESQSRATTPEIQAVELAQISGGIGFSVYHFYDSADVQTRTHLGALLVTNGAFHLVQEVDQYGNPVVDGNGDPVYVCDGVVGFCDQDEYWRWDTTAMTDWQNNQLGAIHVEHAGTFSNWNDSGAGAVQSAFLAAPSGHTWVVNRQFDLQSNWSVVTNSPANDRLLYNMEADHWLAVKDENGDPRVDENGNFVDENGDPILVNGDPVHESQTITYYLEAEFGVDADFDGVVDAYPRMTWYISVLDFWLWQESNANDDDTGSIYEVRLNSDTVMNQTSIGVGYELKTLK